MLCWQDKMCRSQKVISLYEVLPGKSGQSRILPFLAEPVGLRAAPELGARQGHTVLERRRLPLPPAGMDDGTSLCFPRVSPLL